MASLPPTRDIALAPSALSPHEYAAYAPLLAAFDRHPARDSLAPPQLADWLLATAQLPPHTDTVQLEVLQFFAPPPTPSPPPAHLLLALLRLLAHSSTNKYLTRDHAFIQTAPLAFTLLPSATQSPIPPPPVRANPFRRPSDNTSTLSQLPSPTATTSSTSSAPRAAAAAPPPRRQSQGPLPAIAPPLPRPPPTPPPPTTTTNPFRTRVVSSPSPSPTAAHPLTPPLPPRPSKKSNPAARPPSPPRRLASATHAIPGGAHISIISSSGPKIPVLAPKPRPALGGTNTHIGPSVLLTTNTTGGTATATTRTARSSSSVSLDSASHIPHHHHHHHHTPKSDKPAPPPRPPKGTLATASHSTATASSSSSSGSETVSEPLPHFTASSSSSVSGLGRSRTLGSKPAPPLLPPPKRRPESLYLPPAPAKNPFASPPPKPPKSTASAPEKQRRTSVRDLGGLLERDLGGLLGRTGEKGEEWVRGVRGKVEARTGKKSERTRLVGRDRGGEDESGEGEDEPDVEDGWARLDDGEDGKRS